MIDKQAFELNLANTPKRNRICSATPATNKSIARFLGQILREQQPSDNFGDSVDGSCSSSSSLIQLKFKVKNGVVNDNNLSRDISGSSQILSKNDNYQMEYVTNKPNLTLHSKVDKNRSLNSQSNPFFTPSKRASIINPFPSFQNEKVRDKCTLIPLQTFELDGDDDMTADRLELKGKFYFIL
jgi:hypothetical protein